MSAVDRDLPIFDAFTLSEGLAEQRWPFRIFGSMFAIFAVIALVLSAVGTYAVTAYSITQRTHEIGLRMAPGPDRWSGWSCGAGSFSWRSDSSALRVLNR